MPLRPPPDFGLPASSASYGTDAQYLRVYVRQLRQKIEVDPERPQYVLTETGIGYRLRAPEHELQ